MPNVQVRDISMYYEIHGEGEPLVMICGASATTESYTLLYPYFSGDFKVILFDNRGAGRTDKPDIPYTMQMMADDLAGLLDAVGIETAHIYGQSMGGMIAQYFAVSYPARVRSLVLISTTPGGPHAVRLAPSKRFNREARAKMTPEELGMETLRLCVTQPYIDSHPELAREMMANMVKQSEPAYAALRQAEAAQRQDSYDRLPEISAPTLVMAGDADAAVAVENSRILASRIPDAELIIYEGAGHILIEAGEAPNLAVLDFLRRHRSG